MTGILLGAALFGGGTVLASSGVMATPSPQTIYVDGQHVNMTAYNIDGSNYVKLRDVGKAVDFAVTYDAATKSVQIDSNAPYVEESQTPAALAASTAPAGAISVPQTDEAPFVPKEGDVILCDDGTTYKVTDMSHYDKNMFADGPLPPLPTATCDWSQFAEAELPKAEVRHFKYSDGRESLFIRNLYETRRMQYTAYNAIGANPQLWKDGKPILLDNGKPIVQIQLGIPDDANPVGSFWPWRDSEITKNFGIRPAGNFPAPLYQYEAWDVYVDGVFLYTEYKVG